MAWTHQRKAGVLIPLFSLRNAHSWGIGEFSDIGAISRWLEQAGLRVLMLLPLYETAIGQHSPYSALTAFALDPIYLSLDEIEDFHELGGQEALPKIDRVALDAAREAEQIDYPMVRHLKEKWLHRCFERFCASGAARDSARARDLASFRRQHHAWLADYSLFRALKHTGFNSGWWEWPFYVQRRFPETLALARDHYGQACALFEYQQWLADGQLVAARGEAARHGVELAGDLPFVVAQDSADTWSRQEEFRFDATVGAPPDEYSATGQDWGLPAYRWDLIAENDFAWLKQRGERAAQTFDLVRVDHVVGFYRTYVRPRDKSAPYFSPPREEEQTEQGEAVLAALASGGTALIAEDLGTVPQFVRRSLDEMSVPGFRVLRWEKEDEADNFRSPDTWPALSVGTTGTHDTEPLAVWWEQMAAKERSALCQLNGLERFWQVKAFEPEVHQCLLHLVYDSGSDLLILPVQDLFSARERINLPGTVGPQNWSYRLPWTVSGLLGDAAMALRARQLRALAEGSGRAASS